MSSSTRNCLSAMPLSISRTLKVSPPPKSQSSKNRCRYPYGGCLQPQKGVAPPCLTETPTTSNQPSIGNFGEKRGLGCWRGRKRSGMAGCPMKHRRSIQSSPGVLLWANDCGRPNLDRHAVPVLTVLPLLTGVNQEEGDGEKNERTGPLGWVGTSEVFFCRLRSQYVSFSSASAPWIF